MDSNSDNTVHPDSSNSHHSKKRSSGHSHGRHHRHSSSRTNKLGEPYRYAKRPRLEDRPKKEQLQKMIAHVDSCAPFEACGLLAGLNSKVETVLEVANQAQKQRRFS